MNANLWVAILLAAVVAGPVTVQAEPVEPAPGPVEELIAKLNGCPIVYVLTYDPYVVVQPECIPV